MFTEDTEGYSDGVVIHNKRHLRYGTLTSISNILNNSTKKEDKYILHFVVTFQGICTYYKIVTTANMQVNGNCNKVVVSAIVGPFRLYSCQASSRG